MRPFALALMQTPIRTPLRVRALVSKASWHGKADTFGVEFVGSYETPDKMPQLPLPEVMLAGRSNVGKSSALNVLSGRSKKVAVVSKTPGRTRLLNMFRVHGACTISDTPGYGFARVSPELQEKWRTNIQRYLGNRQALRLAVVFVDSQIYPQESDAQLLGYLKQNNIPAVVVATKTDRLKESQLKESLEHLQEDLELPDDQPIPFSSKTGAGRREVWNYIQNVCTQR